MSGLMTTDAPDDDDELGALMRAAQAGDNVAYTRLLKLIAPIARRVAQRRWMGEASPDDVAQDVLLSIHSVRHTYDPARPFRPWLMTIIHNRLVDAQRRGIRRSSKEVVVADVPETFSEEETNWLSDGPGDPEELRQAIANLPPGQRRAIELLKLQEMSLKEAAETSGMSIGALKVAVHRGIKSLREALAK